VFAETKIPVVIDADALNTLAANPQLRAKLGKLGKEGRTLVLTPHPGEMARLAGKTVAEIQANRLQVARSFAQKNGVTLVLKGWRTLIGAPDGSVAVNTTEIRRWPKAARRYVDGLDRGPVGAVSK